MATPTLRAVIDHQLASLATWAGLPSSRLEESGALVELFGAESLDVAARAPFPGLSGINANGLPFQWSLSLPGPFSVRFLCEAGRPGTDPQARLSLTLDRIGAASDLLGHAQASWFRDVAVPLVVPSAAAWPSHWRSAIWIGVGTGLGGSILKPYLNLNAGPARDRWLRVGRVLSALGRTGAVRELCRLSPLVSRGSWPVGVAFDLRPDGQPGRIKLYCRSATVDRGWVDRWADAVGVVVRCGLDRMLDAFPPGPGGLYPERSLVASVEFHADGTSSLKLDVAVTRLGLDANAVAVRVATTLGAGAPAAALAGAIAGLDPARAATQVRFLGWGGEPDGREHVNIYLEPALPLARRRSIGRRRASAPADADRGAIELGVSALVRARTGPCWHDYDLPIGPSDTWVTAYVLASGAPLPTTLRVQGIRWLRSVRTPGAGWGFSQTTENDADSTALALKAIRSAAGRVPADAITFLRSCLVAGGGVATFPHAWADHGIWTRASLDVTPTALGALPDDEPLRASAMAFADRAAQAGNGLWRSFWWGSDLYPTTIAAEAGIASPTRLRDLARVVATYGPEGAFETALLLRLSHAIGVPDRADELAGSLRVQQRGDGTWTPSAWLRVPDPAGASAGRSYLDHAAILTTATALEALTRHLARSGRDPSGPGNGGVRQ